MGFAGQVFAARVAVGLAMPSPKAFSQAGAMIGGFASKMYNSLNKKSIDAAQKSLANAKNKTEEEFFLCQKNLSGNANIARYEN